ncbi:sigma-70 family RNA polymerase sigma factor [Amorphoplanes nipponensis]|uniref:RNA polymerase sigma factor n=1 Tax=Actinoplanes nipponensis TaxID=135950 RepID=A0A919JNQ5_9ACTN|nr:RNA polymerase subunit sigma-70 [Actinoplanes nipponensis]GIE52546.1 RNA polymerase sigma factor [Actinoplanes nipponensis]
MDGTGFAELVEPHRRELLLHCYRMLGSLSDAEDVLQETLVAAWKGLPEFRGRSSLRSWLYRIATNRCLNARRDAGRRVPAAPTPPFEPPAPTRRDAVTWLQPWPDALLEQVPDIAPGPEARYAMKEAVELAFIAALQRLPPRQAAVLILRDVLGYSSAEVAGMLAMTPTVVKGVLQRARSAAGDGRAEPGDEGLAQRFAEAFTAGDIDAVVALLADDAWLTMPPAPHEYRGPAAIGAFLRASDVWRGPRRMLLVPARVNTQPAYACYLAGPGEPVARPAGLMVVTVRGDRIGALTRFHDNAALARLGLLEAAGVTSAG